MKIRLATVADRNAIWKILEPVIRQGETYALPLEMTKDDALRYWISAEKETFVTEEAGAVLGTYYIRPNQMGGGRHVANCGYMTSNQFFGRGVARAMCEHSLAHARAKGYRSMQFNFVVSSNTRAVRLWESIGFEIVGCLPNAFQQPSGAEVDALVMFKKL